MVKVKTSLDDKMIKELYYQKSKKTLVLMSIMSSIYILIGIFNIVVKAYTFAILMLVLGAIATPITYLILKANEKKTVKRFENNNEFKLFSFYDDHFELESLPPDNSPVPVVEQKDENTENTTEEIVDDTDSDVDEQTEETTQDNVDSQPLVDVPTNTITYMYDNLMCINENKKSFFIYLNEREVFVILKDCIIEGNVDELKSIFKNALNKRFSAKK